MQVDTFIEPLRELLYQTYSYNDISKDIYYIELTIKSHANYVTDLAKSFPTISTNATSGPKT